MFVHCFRHTIIAFFEAGQDTMKSLSQMMFFYTTTLSLLMSEESDGHCHMLSLKKGINSPEKDDHTKSL